MKSIIKYITIYFVSSFVLLSSASAITVLAWPGGPAEGALKKVVDNYNKKTILFSPAAASFDSFINFEDRGSYFNRLIKKYINAR